MSWRLSAVLSLLCFYLLSPQSVFATLVLNEISPRSNPEWIELYNTGTEAIDVTGWYFLDKQQTQKLLIAPEPIAPGTYFVFTGVSSWLNNDEEESVTIYDSGGVIIDAVVFPKTAADTTIARQPDFTGPWLTDQPPTQGHTNAQPSPSPVPSPSPSPSSSPQASYSPAVAQAPPSPSPSPAPPSPSPTSTPLPSSTIVQATPSPPAPSLAPTTSEGTVAAATTIDLSAYGQSPSPSPSSIATHPSLSINPVRLRFLLTVGLGLLCLSLALYLARRRLQSGSPPSEL